MRDYATLRILKRYIPPFPNSTISISRTFAKAKQWFACRCVNRPDPISFVPISHSTVRSWFPVPLFLSVRPFFPPYLSRHCHARAVSSSTVANIESSTFRKVIKWWSRFSQQWRQNSGLHGFKSFYPFRVRYFTIR